MVDCTKVELRSFQKATANNKRKGSKLLVTSKHIAFNNDASPRGSHYGVSSFTDTYKLTLPPLHGTFVM